MTDLRAFADTMPDFVKLTVVGLGITPPLVFPDAEPLFVQTLDYFVENGICLAVPERGGRRYHLSQMGQRLRDIVEHDVPRDATIPANDDYPDGPEAA